MCARTCVCARACVRACVSACVRECVRASVRACVMRLSLCLNKLTSPSHGVHLGGLHIKRPGNVMNCREN